MSKIGRTALHFAACAGDVEALETLVSRGLQVDAKARVLPECEILR